MSVLRRDFMLDELRGIAAGKWCRWLRCGASPANGRRDNGPAPLCRRGTVDPRRGWLGSLGRPEPRLGCLDRFADDAGLKGVRHVVQDEPDDRFILGSDFNRGLRELTGRGLVYDILIFARQLPASIEFVDRPSRSGNGPRPHRQTHDCVFAIRYGLGNPFSRVSEASLTLPASSQASSPKCVIRRGPLRRFVPTGMWP